MIEAFRTSVVKPLLWALEWKGESQVSVLVRSLM